MIYLFLLKEGGHLEYSYRATLEKRSVVLIKIYKPSYIKKKSYQGITSMKTNFFLTLAFVVLFSANSLSHAAEPGNIMMETSLGNMEIELFEDKAPISSKNFRDYVNNHFFDGLIFHRVIPGFMIQGGGFLPGMKKKETMAPILNEATNGLKNKRGTLSMARTADINSGTSQFFINVNDNRSLDHRSMKINDYGYAVFGRVVKGLDIADKIVAVPRGRKGHYGDVPINDVIIIKAYEIK